MKTTCDHVSGSEKIEFTINIVMLNNDLSFIELATEAVELLRRNGGGLA